MLDAGAAVWRKAEPMMTPGQSDLAAAHRGPRADDMDDDSDSSDAEHGGGDLQEVDDDVLLGRQQKQQQRAQDPGVTAMAAQLAALQVCSHCVLTLCAHTVCSHCVCAKGNHPGSHRTCPAELLLVWLCCCRSRHCRHRRPLPTAQPRRRTTTPRPGHSRLLLDRRPPSAPTASNRWPSLTLALLASGCHRSFPCNVGCQRAGRPGRHDDRQ